MKEFEGMKNIYRSPRQCVIRKSLSRRVCLFASDKLPHVQVNSIFFDKNKMDEIRILGHIDHIKYMKTINIWMIENY